jgi:acetyl-CoA carboxylase biotin carboxyl carrier protein
MNEASSADRPESALDAIFRNIMHLLATARDTPAQLRVTAGEAAVEIRWQAKALFPRRGDDPPGSPRQDGTLFRITAASVGTFYHSPEPGAATFVRVGEELEPGQQVGILEVMKMMTPVVADRPGRVVEFLVPDGAAVEYGAPLIACAPPGEA